MMMNIKTVSIEGDIYSEGISSILYLEAPTGGWTIRSIGFAEGTKDYWGAGYYNANMRHSANV